VLKLPLVVRVERADLYMSASREGILAEGKAFLLRPTVLLLLAIKVNEVKLNWNFATNQVEGRRNNSRVLIA
jgi:hypothetical protein